jgi:hypothetical protein
VTARDSSAARRSAGRRPPDPSWGGLERDTGPAPALRGLGWGLLVAVVAAVVLFATVLVVEGRARQPQAGAPAPVAAASSSTAPSAPSAPPPPPRSGALSSSTPDPVPPPAAAPARTPEPVPAPQPVAPPSVAPPTPDPAPRPSPQGLAPATDSLRSVDSRTPAVLVLVNSSGGAVTVEWVDYRGGRVGYGEVPDGGRIVLNTFVTHPWVVSDAAGEDLGVALPRAPESTVLVEGPR